MSKAEEQCVFPLFKTIVNSNDNFNLHSSIKVFALPRAAFSNPRAVINHFCYFKTNWILYDISIVFSNA